MFFIFSADDGIIHQLNLCNMEVILIVRSTPWQSHSDLSVCGRLILAKILEDLHHFFRIPTMNVLALNNRGLVTLFKLLIH